MGRIAAVALELVGKYAGRKFAIFLSGSALLFLLFEFATAEGTKPEQVAVCLEFARLFVWFAVSVAACQMVTDVAESRRPKEGKVDANAQPSG